MGMFEALKKGFQATVSTAIDFNSMLQTAQIGFATMLGSAEKAQKFLEDMADFAVRTPFEYPELLEAAKRMLAYGFAAEEVLPTLRAVGDASAALGSGAAGIDRITLALGQIRAKGKLSAEEMRQLTEAGVPAWHILAEAMGKTVPELQDMVSKGLIPGGKAVEMLTKGMTKRFGGMMASMENTWQGVTSSIKDIWRMTVGTLTQNWFSGLNTMLIKVRDFLSQFYQAIQIAFGNKTKQSADAMTNSTEGQAGAMTDLGDAANYAAKAMQKNIQAFDEVHQLAEDTSSSLDFTVGNFADLGLDGLGGSVEIDVEVDTSKVEKLVELLEKLKEALGPVSGYMTDIKNRFGEFYNNVKPSLQEITRILTSDHNPAWMNLKKTLTDIANITKNLIFNDLALIEDSLSIIADLLKGDFRAGWEKFKTLIGEIDWMGLYRGFELLNDPIGYLTRNVLNNAGAFDWLKNIWENLKISAPITWENIKTSILNKLQLLLLGSVLIWNRIKTNIETSWNELKTNAPIVWDNINKSIMNKLQMLALGALIIANSIKTELVNNWNTLKTNASIIWELIKTLISNKWEELKTNATVVWGNIVTTIRDSWELLKSRVSIAWNEIKQAIADKWREIKEDAYLWGKNLISGFVQGVKDKIGSVKDTFKNVGNTIKNFLGFSSPTKEGPGREADKWAPNFMDMFRSGIAQGIPGIRTSVNAVADEMSRLSSMTVQPAIHAVAGTADSGIMSDSIAQAVYRAIIDAFRITQASSQPTAGRPEIVLKMGTREVARAVLPDIISEGQRQGLNLVVQGV